MARIWIKYSIMFISLVLIQTLVLNYIQFSGYINPYVYVLFILLLPVSIPHYALVLLGFSIGIVVDIFSNSPGMHTSATTLAAFMRPYVINVISPRDMDKNDYPGVAQFGLPWFVSYSAVIIVIHHLFYFYIEAFTFAGFFLTMLRSLISSVFTIFLVVLSQFIVFRE